MIDHDRYRTTCGGCGLIWCDACDPAHGPLCPACHGQGFTTHPWPDVNNHPDEPDPAALARISARMSAHLERFTA